MTADQLFQGLLYLLLLGVGVIGYFLKGVMSQHAAEVKTSRENERELFRKLAVETQNRLQMYIEILKDQRDSARKGSKLLE